MVKLFSSKPKTSKDLNGAEVKEAYNNCTNEVLVDVRTAGEFASGSIPGAKNLDIMAPDFQEKIAALDKNKEYFIFCRSGSRSAVACRMMAELGLNTYNLREGVRGWPR